ncbi:MAG: hypothetical protein LBQ74_03980, partial [Prevotella sp.]|nr:hypothetical protein [Prevotella sp.]
KAYEFNIVIGDGQGLRFVGLDVNEVAGWETNPGIEVPRPEIPVKDYVEINGVKWALANVDVPGTFAANETDFGMYYAYGRGAAGWNGNTNQFVDAQETPCSPPSYDGTSEWDMNTQNPCPSGWRVPSSFELARLNAKKNAWIVDRNSSGTNGYSFMDRDQELFLPAAGERNYSNWNDCIQVSRGFYIASDSYSLGSAYCLGLVVMGDGLSFVMAYKEYGFSVRCVKD